MDVYRSKIAVITYNANKKRLYLKWFGFPSSEEFCRAIDATVAFSQKQTFYSMLSDTLEQDVVAKPDTDYAASVMPELVNNGLKGLAFLISGKEHTKYSVDNFTREQKTEIVEHFTSREQAESWLDNCCPGVN
jgi:hypothetical protein